MQGWGELFSVALQRSGKMIAFPRHLCSFCVRFAPFRYVLYMNRCTFQSFIATCAIDAAAQQSTFLVIALHPLFIGGFNGECVPHSTEILLCLRNPALNSLKEYLVGGEAIIWNFLAYILYSYIVPS